MSRAHIGVAALLSIVVGWFVFDGVSSLIGLPAFYAQLGVPPGDVPWVALWIGAVQPVALFLTGAALARHRPLTSFTLVLITAIAASAALRLTIIAVATGSITLVG